MKTKILVVIFLLVHQIYSLGQDFAPIGAEWYYTEQFVWLGDISYLWIKSTADTMIEGKDCRILESNGGPDCAFSYNQNIVYDEDSVVYFYEPNVNTFQILYDLKAKKGSTWTVVFGIDSIQAKLDTILIKVDSISSITINSIPLKKLFVTYQSMNFGYENWSYIGTIIERIGDLSYLFNLNTLSGMICDGSYSLGLRCYQDSEIGFYSTGIAESCTYTHKVTGTNDKCKDFDIDILPNPTSGLIEIKTNNEFNIATKIVIYDCLGNTKLVRNINNETKVDLSILNNALYFMTIIRNDKILGIKKIIKY
jgi:hypothetical protein